MINSSISSNISIQTSLPKDALASPFSFAQSTNHKIQTFFETVPKPKEWDVNRNFNTADHIYAELTNSCYIEQTATPTEKSIYRFLDQTRKVYKGIEKFDEAVFEPLFEEMKNAAPEKMDLILTETAAAARRSDGICETRMQNKTTAQLLKESLDNRRGAIAQLVQYLDKKLVQKQSPVDVKADKTDPPISISAATAIKIALGVGITAYGLNWLYNCHLPVLDSFFTGSIFHALDAPRIAAETKWAKTLQFEDQLKLGVYEGCRNYITGTLTILLLERITRLFPELKKPEKPLELSFADIVIILPLIEEILFRGVLQTYLSFRIKSSTIQILGSGLPFGAIHLTNSKNQGLLSAIRQSSRIVLFPGHSILYATTGTLFAPIAAHMTNNFICDGVQRIANKFLQKK